MNWTQPPSGGCVLKPQSLTATISIIVQPPSGGCVLKQLLGRWHTKDAAPAAFGRLCVETPTGKYKINTHGDQPPSGGCVLKPTQWCPT